MKYFLEHFVTSDSDERPDSRTPLFEEFCDSQATLISAIHRRYQVELEQLLPDLSKPVQDLVRSRINLHDELLKSITISPGEVKIDTSIGLFSLSEVVMFRGELEVDDRAKWLTDEFVRPEAPYLDKGLFQWNILFELGEISIIARDISFKRKSKKRRG